MTIDSCSRASSFRGVGYTCCEKYPKQFFPRLQEIFQGAGEVKRGIVPTQDEVRGEAKYKSTELRMSTQNLSDSDVTSVLEWRRRGKRK